MSGHYVMPGSPSSASGGCPGSPTISRSLDDLLICPVCLDSYKDPKTLTCLHSFCSRCLEHCRRPYRRDITCPVCKKVTALSPMGVPGLQNDFRIQQIRDILLNRPSSPGTSSEDARPTSPGPEGKACDLCRTQMKASPANSHCIQCYMYFCSSCSEKHNGNPLFASHHVINMSESQASATLFCKTHKEHPVRYFCKPCSVMLCTICTLEHDPSHAPEPLEKGIIDKYRQELHESLRTIKSKLSEVKSRTKYLETMKQSHQQALYSAQRSIKEKTEEIVSKIREQEQQLLAEVQGKIDGKMREFGVISLGEINFHRSSIESLYTDIQRVIQGSPQDCLIAYEDLITRMKGIDASLPSLRKRRKGKSSVRFVPAESDLKLIIGSLQEISLSSESSDDEGLASSPPASGFSSPVSAVGTKQLGPNRRTNSILNAISPGRKTDVKIGKVKAFCNGIPNSLDLSPSSPPSTINADELGLVASGGASVDPGDASPSSPSASPPCPSSPRLEHSDRPTIQYKTKPLYKVDQIGGWPGRISSPSSVAFMQDGSVVVTESESRLQVFDKTGHSIRIIGWGKVKPQCVAISRDGKIMITDKKDRCIKCFEMTGEVCGVWGAGQFSQPSGITVCSSGNIVITDLDTNSISIHNPDGTLITKFGSWGSGEYQFNHPTHVTVDFQDNIIVSDSGNSAVKIYDKNGVFIKQFGLQSSKQGLLRRPQGLAADREGNLIIADRENHRISLFSSEGRFLKHLLTKQDGIRFPCDVKVDYDSVFLAVVESHSGFLSKDPHHAIKLFQVL